MSEPLHHSDFAPSSATALNGCPVFESAPDESADAKRGTMQHAATVELLRGADCPIYASLSAFEQSCVDWAVAFIQDHCEGPLLEERIEVLDENFDVVTFGTVDVLESAPVVTDLKFGVAHAYLPQLAIYGVGAMDRFGAETCLLRILYCRDRRVEERVITLAEARGVMEKILGSKNNPAKFPTVCDFCGWCRYNGACPAQTEKALEILTARAVPVSVYHPSQVSDPRLMAELLALAKPMEDFAGSVKHHAKALILSGVDIPGYELKERRGKPKVIDVNEAFNRLALPPEAFIKACDLSLPKVAEAYGAANNLSKATARKKVEEELNGVIERGQPIMYLSKTGETDDASIATE